MKIKLPDLSKFHYPNTGHSSALTPFGWAVADIAAAGIAFHNHRDAGGVLFTLGSALFTVVGFQDLRKVWPNFAKPATPPPPPTPVVVDPAPSPPEPDPAPVVYPLPEDNFPGVSQAVKSATITWGGSGHTTSLDPATIVINPITPEVPNVSPSETQSATKYIPKNYPED